MLYVGFPPTALANGTFANGEKTIARTAIVAKIFCRLCTEMIEMFINMAI
jgi:hypothetical protein